MIRRSFSFLLLLVALLAMAFGSFAALADPAVDPSMALAIADGIVTPAPSVTPIPETADPSAAIPLVLQLVSAVEQGQWAIAAGLALMIATFLALRVPQLRERVPKDYTATFLLGMSLFGSFGASLAGGAPPARAALAALVCSSIAIAFWEGIAKHLVKLWAKHTSPAVDGGA